VDSFAATIGPIIIRALTGTSQQIRMWSGITPTLEALLEARQLDMAVTTAGVVGSASGVRRQKLFTEPYCVVLPKEFALDKYASLTDLSRRLRFIRYSARSVIGQDVDAYLMAHSDNIERTSEFDTTDPMLSLVAAGLGFAITTPLCIWQSRHFVPQIRVVPLEQFVRHGRPYQQLARTFYLGSRENELGNLPNEMHDLLRQAYEKQVSKDIAQALDLRPEQVYLRSAD
jgi:DNA-binding transcriptional LysR family regulator